MMARLGDICRFQSGGTPSKNEPSYFNGDIPWITTVALSGNVIGADDAIEWITEKAIKESAAKIVPAHSIMVGTRVGIGKVAMNSIPMSTSQDIISLIEIDENRWSKPYLCKLISGQNEFLNTQARGATIKGIKIDVLANIDVPDIPLPKQCHIASVLERVSYLIALRKQQLDKLDELVKARFVEMFGDVRMNPYNFNKSTMGVIAAELFAGGDKPSDISDQQDAQHLYPVYANGEINNGLQGYTKDYRVSDDAVTVAARGTIGFCCIREACFTPIVRLITIVPKEQINIVYLAYAIRLVKFKSSGSSQAQLTVPDFRNVPILVPPLELQQQFTTFAKQTEKARLTIRQGLDKLETLKKALMQRYFG